LETLVLFLEDLNSESTRTTAILYATLSFI